MDRIREAIKDWLVYHNFIEPKEKSTVLIHQLTCALPEPIEHEFSNLEDVIDNNYGLIFAVKDLYEVTLKVICLSVCYLLYKNNDDAFCKALLSPKQLSFGDWVSSVPAALRKTEITVSYPAIKNYLKKLSAFYNKSKIVYWRNNYIGHGLMSGPQDEAFFQDVCNKINDLIDFLNTHPVPNEINAINYDSMGPFIYREDDHVYIFESVNQDGDPFYLDQFSRIRCIRKCDYFSEKWKKFNNQLTVIQENKIWNQQVYLTSEDNALNGYYLSNYYKKPSYMKDWLESCVNQYENGIFLLQGARGTGKSSFSLACDELNQHGDQTIKLKSDGESVSVRCYYCSRIGFSNQNDFFHYLKEIFCTLPNGEQIRLRTGDFPDIRKGLPEFLRYFQKQYLRLLGSRKLILIIDGIDELSENGWSILKILSGIGSLPDGVYILLTCRNEEMEILPLVNDFIRTYSFVARVNFDRNGENHRLMSEIIADLLHIEKREADRIADSFDNRLSVIPLLSNVPEQAGRMITDLSEYEQKDKILLKAYLKKVELCYGERLYLQFIRFLMCIAEAFEGLTLNELSMMASFHDTTLREICFLKDAAPLLQEFRSYRGNVYFLARPEYKPIIRKLHSDLFTPILIEWENRILNLGSDAKITESEQEILLYFSANLGELQSIYKDALVLDEQKILCILWKMYHICKVSGPSDQVHRAWRTLRALRSIEITLVHMVSTRKTQTDEAVTLLLECSSDVIEAAVLLRELSCATDVIKEVNDCIEKNTELFQVNDWHREFTLARFYSCCMTRYCEIYDVPKADEYYKAAERILCTIPSGEQEYKKYCEIKRTLRHNYLGVLRNENPQGAIDLLDKFVEECDQEINSFHKVNDLLMIAMCYKSAGQYVNSLNVLEEARDIAEAVLEASGTSYWKLTDPYEQMIYLTLYWRLAQCIDEKAKSNIDAVSFSEIKIAIHVLDMFIESVIWASQRGYSQFDLIRLDMMTTAALLRNIAALKADISKRKGIIYSAGSINGVEEYKNEAIQAIKIIELSYQKLDNANVEYNKIDGMFNRMNCACVYAGFGEYEKAVSLLEYIIDFYHPENQQENMVHSILRRKLVEIKGYMTL